MAASMAKYVVGIGICVCIQLIPIKCTGILTHVVISHRAQTYFDGIPTSTIDFKKLIDKHPDALLSGSVYPDAFYNQECSKGNYSFVSDDAHWGPFLNATLDYILTKYAKPWDDSTEKLVVFTLGMLSHQIADVLWYSYGIQQGFLSTMANVNFHGSLADAMEFGELGSDVMADYDLNLGYINPFQDWHIPFDDLVNIYNNFYGPDKVPESVIQNCSTTLIFTILKEKAVISEYFGDVAPGSPFLINQMSDYFLGGMDSSAGWVHRKWMDAAVLLENGTSACTIPRNPLFINCGRKKSTLADETEDFYEHHINHRFLLDSDSGSCGTEAVEVNRTDRGFTMRPSSPCLRLIEKQISEMKYLVEKKHSDYKFSKFNLNQESYDTQLDYTGVYFVNSSYAKLGWITEVGDIDGDGNMDLIMGAPGYGEVGSPQQGRVFFVYGTKDELPGYGYIAVNLDNTTVTCTDYIKSPSLVIDCVQCPQYSVQFEESLKIAEEQTLPYPSYIHAFPPAPPHLASSLSLTQRWYLNIKQDQIRFGSSVAVLDINLDGVIDVAVGAPSFANEDPLEYNGAVFIYYGTANKRGFSTPNITIKCQSTFCNLGYSLTVADVDSNGHRDLVIGTPFYGVTANQTGIVSALLSRADYTNNQTIQFEDLLRYWNITGNQMYGWMGYKVTAKDDVLMISQPQYRKCSSPDCKISENDIQAVGDLTIVNFGSKVKMPNTSLAGISEFNMIGYSSDFGYPYDNSSLILAIGVPGAAVDGNLFSIPIKLRHAGSVVLFNVSANGAFKEIAHFDGDRDFAGFGSFVKFDDINNDGFDDLMIGAPMRSDDWTELIPRFINLAEDGRLFVFYGGQQFPRGNATFTDACDIFAPCPEAVANETIIPVSPKGDIGYNAAVLKYQNMTNLVVTAVRSTDFFRNFPLTGSVNLFRYNHTVST